MKLPVFPLPIFLLPEGITRLRIFEQRYLNMVRNINKTQGFVIRYCAGKESDVVPEWGSWVEIIDFDTDNDGVLVIDVQCKKLVLLDDYTSNHEMLLFAQTQIKAHWFDSALQSCHQLSAQLQQFFARNQQFGDLYKTKHYNNPTWVCSRWLELLPVTFKNKSHFITPEGFLPAKQFVESILMKNLSD